MDREETFFFFQTADTGNRTPNSSVKDSGANHYPRAPALCDHIIIIPVSTALASTVQLTNVSLMLATVSNAGQTLAQRHVIVV